MSSLVRSRRLRRLALTPVIALASAAVAVPSASALTTTPLGQCTHPKPPYPNLERLNVPGTVKVGADGRPVGASVGISVRNFVLAYEGSGVDLQLVIVDASSGRPVGTLGTLSWGCARYLWSLREANALYPVTGPMTLKRNRVYLVRASAGFIDTSGMDPTYGLGGLVKFPVGWFVTV